MAANGFATQGVLFFANGSKNVNLPAATATLDEQQKRFAEMKLAAAYHIIGDQQALDRGSKTARRRQPASVIPTQK